MKKAQFAMANLLLPVLGTIAIVAIVLVLTQFTLSKTRDIAENKIVSLSKNESLTWAGNATRIILIESTIVDGSEKLYNNGTIVNRGGAAGIGNYTIGESFINITNISQYGAGAGITENGSPQWVTNALNLSYDYKIGSLERNTTKVSQGGVKAAQDYLPVIALVGAMVAVVAGFAFFYFKIRLY